MNISQPEQAKTFGDWAYLAIAKHFSKIMSYEKAVLKDKDPEELHQMRVGMRRLRSAITGFSAALILPKYGSEKQVGRMARVLGDLRDLDVLKETLEQQYQPSLTKPEQKYLKLIYKELQDEREKAFKKVQVLLTGENYRQFKEDLKQWLEQPEYQAIARFEIAEVLPDLLLPQISDLLLHPGWFVGVKDEIQVGTPERVEQILIIESDRVHSLRKEAKRSRYNMSLFSHFYGERYHQYVEDMKQLQTVLGDIQDSFVLTYFLAKTCAFEIHKKLPSLVDKLKELRYNNWQKFSVLQTKFLDFETRQDLRLTVQNPRKNNEDASDIPTP